MAPEVSLLLAVVTMIVSPFCVISHPDGSGIDLGVEGHFHIIPILHRVVIVDVLWDVVLFGLNLHGRFYLCSMDSDIRVVVILPAITCLVLMSVVQPLLMRVHIIGSIGRFARRLGVCLSILCLPTPTKLSLILLTLTHGDQ